MIAFEVARDMLPSPDFSIWGEDCRVDRLVLFMPS
jgi:hypothetical protein